MKLAEDIFERFNAPSFYIAKNAVLTAFAHGKSNALVFDSGAKQTFVAPVQDGYVLLKNISHVEIGGDDLTDWGINFYEAKNNTRFLPK